MSQKKLFFLQTAALVLLYLLCLLYDIAGNPYEKQSHSLCLPTLTDLLLQNYSQHFSCWNNKLESQTRCIFYL